MASLDPTQLFSVKGMVVVITGGGTGIGLMMTKAFALNGAAKVYIVGRRKEKVDEAAKIASNIVPLVGDVTSKESLTELAAHIKQDSGYVNLLICNSGYMPPPIGLDPTKVSVQEYAKKALEQKFEDWTNTFATNSASIAFNAFAFLELLDAGNAKGNCPDRKSQILVTSSIAGYLRNPANFGAYPASKAAATHLVKHLSGTLVPYSIRVNALAPGLFKTDLATSLLPKTEEGVDPTAEGALATDFIPAQRLGRDADMVGTVLFLASAAGSYVNGNIHVMDGGRIGVLHSTY